MTYLVKEIYYTLQGEGTHAGRPAVFCRFTSCNLWTGREKDRARARPPPATCTRTAWSPYPQNAPTCPYRSPHRQQTTSRSR